jgi:hypothetical protein
MKTRITTAVSVIAMAMSFSTIGTDHAMAKGKSMGASSKVSRSSSSRSGGSLLSTSSRRPRLFGNVDNIDAWVGGIRTSSSPVTIRGGVESPNVIESIGAKYTLVRRR